MKGDMAFKAGSLQVWLWSRCLVGYQFDHSQGSKVAFVGISGSGKTTLAKMMVNFMIQVRRD